MNKTKTIIGDFYDAWRDQDMDRMASYLPHDFAHVIHVPSELHPLGGARLGKAEFSRGSPRFSASTIASRSRPRN